MRPPCLILAAGFGTRMGALTAGRPKPLVPVGGRTLLDHALAIAAPACGPIAVNAHYHADQIAAHLAGRPDVTLLIEAPRILGSGGAVKNAARHLPPGPMATLNADAVWTGPNPIRTLALAFDPARMGALLLLVPRDRATGRTGGGDARIDAGGRLRFDRAADAPVYTGAQILDPALARDHPAEAFALHEVWDVLAGQGRLFGVMHPGGWADVGHPEGIALAEALLAGARDV